VVARIEEGAPGLAQELLVGPPERASGRADDKSNRVVGLDFEEQIGACKGEADESVTFVFCAHGKTSPWGSDGKAAGLI